jgi:hypothetical protein
MKFRPCGRHAEPGQTPETEDFVQGVLGQRAGGLDDVGGRCGAQHLGPCPGVGATVKGDLRLHAGQRPVLPTGQPAFGGRPADTGKSVCDLVVGDRVERGFHVRRLCGREKLNRTGAVATEHLQQRERGPSPPWSHR